MPIGEATYAQSPVEAERCARRRVERVAHQDRAVVGHRDEAVIERGVEMGGKQDPVVDIEPLRVRLAVRPGLDVALSLSGKLHHASLVPALQETQVERREDLALEVQYRPVLVLGLDLVEGARGRVGHLERAR